MSFSHHRRSRHEMEMSRDLAAGLSNMVGIWTEMNDHPSSSLEAEIWPAAKCDSKSTKSWTGPLLTAKEIIFVTKERCHCSLVFPPPLPLPMLLHNHSYKPAQKPRPQTPFRPNLNLLTAFYNSAAIHYHLVPRSNSPVGTESYKINRSRGVGFWDSLMDMRR